MSSYKYLKSVTYFTRNQLGRLVKLACEIEEEKKMVDKFEIGDKVHFCYLDAENKFFTPEMPEYFDCIGTIVGIEHDDGLMVEFVEPNACGNTSIVFELYIDWLELVEKAKKPWNGKVVCVDSDNSYFTKGKIYEVKNGLLLDNNEVAYFSDYKYYECPADDSLKPVTTDFIEFKGFANE